MAYKVLSRKLSGIRSEDSSMEYVCEYLCDTESDANALPDCGTGSTAVVIETARVLIVNTKGEWVAFGG